VWQENRARWIRLNLARLGIVKHHPNRAAIEAALIQGMTCATASKAFHIPVESVKRFRRTLPGIEVNRRTLPKPPPPSKIVPGLDAAEMARLRPKKLSEVAPEIKPPAPIEPVSVSLRSPSDVLGALESVVSESLALLERSKATGDLRMQNSLLNTLVATLDKLAKSVGLYQDGTVVNVNTTNQRLELAVSKLSDDQLLALLGGVSA
jgi:hypothetical protein